MMNDPLYFFGIGETNGDASMKALLGGKGANLAQMVLDGFPVPPGFTITTAVCNEYLAAEDKPAFMDSLMNVYVMPALVNMEDHFGYMPLLSVRSGAPESMPGMMDTILNIGVTDETMPLWIETIGEKPALDCKRRFLQMFGETACEIEHNLFEERLDWVRECKYGMKNPPATDADFGIKHLRRCIDYFEELYAKVGVAIPQTLEGQLYMSIDAVFKSWESDRAIYYREMNGMDDNMGTAVNVQAMVFGNTSNKSCSGVLFTRNLATGENEHNGDYLPNAQGEEVVAGTRDTLKIEDSMKKWNKKVYNELLDLGSKLEAYYRDAQDIEFTVQEGTLYLLQTRNAQRSAEAAFRIAVEMVHEGMIEKEVALSRVTTEQYQQLNHPRIDPDFKAPPHLVGIPAGGHIVSGVIATSSDEATLCIEDCILVTEETTPNDIAGMKAAVGILTQTGGATSHAAVVARGMDKSCVVGCTDLDLDQTNSGGKVTIDGSTGNVWFGVDVPVIAASMNEYAVEIIDWVVSSEDEFVERVVATPEIKDMDLSKHVYLDTITIEGREGMENLLVYLSNADLDTVYLDLATKYDHAEEADSLMWGLFGEEHNAEALISAKVVELAHHEWPTALKERTILFTPEGVDKSLKSKLTKSGWKVATRVFTMNDLLDSDGVVDLTDDFKQLLGGVDVVAKLMGVFKAAGKEMSGVPKAISRTRKVFDILGGGE